VGFARPAGGIKPLLDLLVKRFRALGGELRMGQGVEEILLRDGRARGVRLTDGSELTADRVLSSAGFVETMRLCGTEVAPADRGRLTFIESIVVTDRPPASFGLGSAVLFWNDAPELRYGVPDELVDASSGVLCCPNNYASEEPMTHGVARVTVRAHPDAWMELPEGEYRARKQECAERAFDAAARHAPDPRPFELDRDTFTPRTIRHYTGHDCGAVYGSPTKRLDGETGVAGLHLCGTDQGLLGVVGAMLSGISMANRHALAQPA
jgi:phytoene dehydrogenase-like protein